MRTTQRITTIQIKIILIERDSKLIEDDATLNFEDVICDILLFSGGKILTEDIKLLVCFAVFAAVSIERSQLMDLATLGQGEMKLKQ